MSERKRYSLQSVLFCLHNCYKIESEVCILRNGEGLFGNFFNFWQLMNYSLFFELDFKFKLVFLSCYLYDYDYLLFY